MVVRPRVDPSAISGLHHGAYDNYRYIVSGADRFEHGPGGMNAFSIGPGDFYYVSARTVRRDLNPSGTEGQEVMLFLQGSGPMVVNVEGLDSA